MAKINYSLPDISFLRISNEIPYSRTNALLDNVFTLRSIFISLKIPSSVSGITDMHSSKSYSNTF